MKKRISYADWTAIGPDNYAVKWVRPMCKYTLVKEGDKFKREQRIPLWFYILIFIPAHLIQILWCCGMVVCENLNLLTATLVAIILALRAIPPMKKQKKFGKRLDKALSLCYN